MAKQIKFVCDASECPNQGVEYIWATNDVAVAQCGGCGAELQAQDA